MKGLNTFIFGAAAGAAVALLMAPESGRDLRLRIRQFLKKKGLMAQDEVDILAGRIAYEIEKD